jgi:predicted metal-dependent phosphoesterase TrpH
VKIPTEGLPNLISSLKESGLGGIEVYYSTHSQSDTNRYLALSKKLDLVVTGGSDFHGLTKPDIAVGTGRGGLSVSSKLLAPLQEAVARL